MQHPVKLGYSNKVNHMYSDTSLKNHSFKVMTPNLAYALYDLVNNPDISSKKKNLYNNNRNASSYYNHNSENINYLPQYENAPEYNRNSSNNKYYKGNAPVQEIYEEEPSYQKNFTGERSYSQAEIKNPSNDYSYVDDYYSRVTNDQHRNGSVNLLSQNVSNYRVNNKQHDQRVRICLCKHLG